MTQTALPQRFRCCACCTDPQNPVNPELHAERGRDFHDTNCTLCDGNADLEIVRQRDSALTLLDRVREAGDPGAIERAAMSIAGLSERLWNEALAATDRTTVAYVAYYRDHARRALLAAWGSLGVDLDRDLDTSEAADAAPEEQETTS